MLTCLLWSIFSHKGIIYRGYTVHAQITKSEPPPIVIVSGQSTSQTLEVQSVASTFRLPQFSYAVDPYMNTDECPTLISFGDNSEFDAQSQLLAYLVC